MKARVGVYLSEQMSARLAAAAKRPGATKSALVETALDHFLGSDDDIGDTAMVARRLTALSRQLEHLDRDLRIVNETVALHARFHLAVTPAFQSVAQRAACTLGAERFEEFAAQVERRVHFGKPLMRETMDRRSANSSTRDLGEGEPPGITSESGLRVSTERDSLSERTAAVREDGSNARFPIPADSPYH
jgi:hypothetical protein